MHTTNRHHHQRRSWLACLLAVFMLLFCMSSTAAASPKAETRKLRVAFPTSTGISEIDQYGNHKGLLVDYLNEISKYTNWEYEYIAVDSEDLIDNFLDGQYDLMGGTYYSPAFEKYFAYPEYNTGRSMATLLCLQTNDSIRGYNLNSLNGKTIGVYQQAKEKIQYLNKFLANNGLDCKIRYYTLSEMDKDGTLYSRLRNGEVDMIMGNELEAGGEFRMVSSFQAQPYYIVTNVGNQDVLNGLNTALKNILESNPEFAEKVYNENFGSAKSADIQFNEQEIKYIQEKKTVSVAVVKNWHPLFCMNDTTDHHDGLIPSLIKEMKEFTGLEFTYVYANTYEEAIQMVQRGDADILGSYIDTEEKAFSDGLALSQSYIGLNNIILKNKTVSYPGSDLTCGILAGRALPSDLEAAKILHYANVSEMVEAVNKGEVDYIYGVSATLEKEIQNHRYLNIVPVTRINNNTEVSFAVARPITPELLTILNKAIGDMTEEEKTTMLDQNLISVGYTSLPLQELIYANPVAFIAIFVTIAVLVMLGVLLMIRSRMKNSVMRSKLEAAEAKSDAKSEFLSRMSHEIRTPMNAIMGLTDLTCMEKDLPLQVDKNLKKIRNSSQYLLSLINDILEMSRIENGKMEMEQENFSLSSVIKAIKGMMGAQAEQKSIHFDETHKISHDWLVGDPIRLRQVLTNLLSNAIKFTDAGGEVFLEVKEISSDETSVEYRFSVRDTGVGIPLEDQKRIFSSFEQLGTSTARSAGTGLGLPISGRIVRLMGGDLKVESAPGKGSEFYTTLRFPLGTEEESMDAAAGGEPKELERSLEGVRVLLAEDNDLNAEIAQELLSIQGIQVRRAANGQEAVDLFQASKPGEYQIILMDIRMPVKDGQEATREIRASGRPDADVPIIAMTANSFKEDEEAAWKAGMSGFVPKPVDSNYLFSIIKKNLK